MKSFAAEHLLEDVDSIPVLSVPGVLLKPLHVLPVLQRQADLRRRRRGEDESEKQLGRQHGVGNVGNVGNVSHGSDVLSGNSRLTSVQAVQQVKSSHSDLEAERGQEETAGLVQDHPSERSQSALREGATATEFIRFISGRQNCEKSCLFFWDYMVQSPVIQV